MRERLANRGYKVSDDGKTVTCWWFDNMGPQPMKLTGPITDTSLEMSGTIPGMGTMKIVEKKVSMSYGGIPVVRGGIDLGQMAEEQANAVLKQREFRMTVDLGLGRGSVTVWTSDLTVDYVKINASYRS